MPESIESGRRSCNRVETVNQLLRDRVAMDTSTSVHANTLSRLINIAKTEHASKSPKELCHPQIRHSIKNVISESEKPHLASLYSTLSANDARSLANVVDQFK